VIFRDGCVLLPQGVPDEDAAAGLPQEAVKEGFADFSPAGLDIIPGISGQGAPMAAWNAGSQAALPPLWRAVTLRSLIAGLGTRSGSLLRAWHIVQWRRDSVFCGRCGTRNIDAPAPEYARLCPACAKTEFPRISPAVIVLVEREGAILLAHNRNFQGGIHSLVAGFVEPGETLEAAACREVMEETAVKVRDVRYVASQSWPFPNSLMLGFRARYLSGDIKPDGTEIDHAAWYTKDALPELPGHGSIARAIIESWINKE
jgi:NAD+ diphosphatase